jgi:hypothetical protein
MIRIRFALVLSGVALSAIAFRAQTPAPQAADRFQQIVPGVYSAIGTGTVNVGSHSAVIVNRDEVMCEVMEHRADQ